MGPQHILPLSIEDMDDPIDKSLCLNLSSQTQTQKVTIHMYSESHKSFIKTIRTFFRNPDVALRLDSLSALEDNSALEYLYMTCHSQP